MRNLPRGLQLLIADDLSSSEFVDNERKLKIDDVREPNNCSVDEAQVSF